MNKSTKQASTNEYQNFNGIRGIAAIIVFFSHAVSMFYTGDLHFLLWDGATAVNIFFVLSGFFLSLNYVNENNRHLNIPSYLIKRFFRLYSVYIIGMLFAIALQQLLFQPGMLNGLSDWINSKWVSPPSLNDIFGYMLVFGSSVDSINSTMWAMRVFIFISLMFPLIIIPLKRINSLLGLLLLFFVSCVVHVFIPILKFLPIFVIGAILAKYHKALYTLMDKRLNNYMLLPLFLFSLLLINIRFFMPLFFGIFIPEHGLLIDPIMAAGWIVFLYFAYSKKILNPILSNKYFLFLGKISYSVYIVHFPILLTVTSNIYPLTDNIILTILLSLITTIIVAYIFYAFIEVPSKKIGYKFADKLSQIQVKIETKVSGE